MNELWNDEQSAIATLLSTQQPDAAVVKAIKALRTKPHPSLVNRAIIHARPQVLQSLLEAGADPDGDTLQFKIPATHLCCGDAVGWTQCLPLLLSAGADVTLVDSTSELTLFEFVVDMDDCSGVRDLLSLYGFHPDGVHRDGLPLFLALDRGNKAMTELLTAAGASMELALTPPPCEGADEGADVEADVEADVGAEGHHPSAPISHVLDDLFITIPDLVEDAPPIPCPKPPPERFKMVFVVRKDLKMGTGKIAAQVGHATLGTFNACAKMYPEWLDTWLKHGAAKIALKTHAVEELRTLYTTAYDMGIPAHLVCDAGKTQLAPKTITVLGLGPAPASCIDVLTSHLKLL